MSTMNTSNLTKENLRRMFSQNKRFDGRGLLDSREFEVGFDVSNKAEGSARVRLGKSDVIVGVKMDIGAPYPDSKDSGNLIVSGDLLPIASPRFESGPPRFNAIELPRLIDRMVRESGMIDLKRLVIKEGEKVWNLYIDIYPINDDGALIDAASIACIAALNSAKIPGIKEGDLPDYKNKSDKGLPLRHETQPLTFTIYKLAECLIVDPTREEEESCDGKIVLGISKWNGKYMINSCQKGLETTFTRQEIERIAEILPKKYEEAMEKLKRYLK